MLVGYARTSTLERTAGLEVHRRELATLGCGAGFTHQASGSLKQARSLR
jgi:hypothetical protein